MHRTKVATRPAISIPVAAVVLVLTTLDSVLPFRAPYADNTEDAAKITNAADQYAITVNTAIPENCGVLQLPYMAYPEFGVVRGVNDYDHFWTSITNPGKKWSYGAVKNTDAGIWSSQLPEVPNDEQVAALRSGGFCAIHVDTRGYVAERLPLFSSTLESRFGPPVATGLDGEWLLYNISEGISASPEEADKFFHQAMITPDAETTQPRQSILEDYWWWMKGERSIFTLTSTRPETPIATIRGEIQAPTCGARPVTLVLAANGSEARSTVIAQPDTPTAFTLSLPDSSNTLASLEIQAPGADCQGNDFEWKRYAQVLNLRSY